MPLTPCNADVVHDRVRGAALGTITRTDITSPEATPTRATPTDRQHHAWIHQ